MLDVIKKIEQEDIVALLEKPEIWNSLDIDYHPPRVERIWCQHGDYRIYLHVIYPCEREEALYHSHPWPSAMHIIEGEYEMGIGYAVDKFNQQFFGIVEPSTIATAILPAGAYYEMLDPNGFHYVRPIKICKTIMITGKPFEKPIGTFKSDKPLEKLSEDRKEEIRLEFLSFYSL